MKFVYLLLSFTIIVSVFLIEDSAHAEAFGSSPQTCSDVDLRSEIGPIRDQGDIGWCFANASADLLTFHYRHILLGEQVSAGYLAIAYNNLWSAWRKPTESGGFVSATTYQAIRDGLCPREAETVLLSHGIEKGLSEKLNFLTELKTRYDGSGFRATYKWIHQQAEAAKALDSPLLQMPVADLEELLASSTPKNFLKNFADHFCQNRINGLPKDFVWTDPVAWFHDSPQIEFDETPHLEAITPVMQNWALKDLHHQLDRSNIVAVDYFPQFFDRPIATPVDTNGSTHASIIAGRRWNKEAKRCELLLRNSWGTGCHYKNPELQAPGYCDGGNLWIPEKDFAKYLTGVVYFR
jgi:hypothetical protein